jgi:hypothetical protein
MAQARAMFDEARILPMLSNGQKAYDQIVESAFQQKWNFESASAIYGRLKRKARFMSAEYNEIILCVDELATRKYYKEIRASQNNPYAIDEHREIKRLYPEVKQKYIVETPDGWVKMIGSLNPMCQSMIVETVQNAHGKEELWLVTVWADGQQMKGYSQGWHATG